MCSDAWLLYTFWKRNVRCWIAEQLLAYLLGRAYQANSTLSTTHWPRCFTASDIWYSVKKSSILHWMLQMWWSWISTSAEMSLRYPYPQRRNQFIVKWKSHCMTIHIRTLHIYNWGLQNWLAMWRHLAMHGSGWQKDVIGTMQASWQSLYNWLLMMRNSTIQFTFMLPLRSTTLVRMRLTIRVWSHSNWLAACAEAGYDDERWSHQNWSAWIRLRFWGDSWRENGFGKLLGIQHSAQWSMHCSVDQDQASVWKKVPNQTY